MATSVVVTCCMTVHDCRAYVVLVRLLRFTPSEEFFTKELLVCIYCCLGCTYRYMGNRLSFLNSGFKTGLVSAVMFETCSVLSLSSVEVPHIRFKFKDRQGPNKNNTIQYNPTMQIKSNKISLNLAPHLEYQPL